MRVLGIESSCDDTAAAVVEDGRRTLSSIVANQDDVHTRFGGVVPELASRSHVTRILRVIDESLSRAELRLEDIDGIAATYGPGLIGSLLVGVQTAKAISHARGIPFVGVNHHEGHLHAIFLGNDPPALPFVALVVSGGHTSLVHALAPGEYEILGETRDDAAGEAFDKAAKMLGLPYPGGVHIERAARTGDPNTVAFPRALPRRDNLEFSFSGLKTALKTHLSKHPVSSQGALADVCASLQEAIVDVLVRKSMRALRHTQCTRLVLAGGVAANTRLRERITAACAADGARAHLPDKRLCTDNAAMIAAAGFARLQRGERHGHTLNADANLGLGRALSRAATLEP
jgi:N6-L-threonylcarbamoyladenine synthase